MHWLCRMELWPLSLRWRKRHVSCQHLHWFSGLCHLCCLRGMMGRCRQKRSVGVWILTYIVLYSCNTCRMSRAGVIVFHALAAQDEALTTEPEMKKKACFMPTSPLIFWIVPSLLPQGDDGTLQTKEECGCLNLDLYSTVFMQYLQNVKGWCDCFSCTGCAGWSFDHWARDEEAGMFPASLCIEFLDCAIFAVSGDDGTLQIEYIGVRDFMHWLCRIHLWLCSQRGRNRHCFCRLLLFEHAPSTEDCFHVWTWQDGSSAMETERHDKVRFVAICNAFVDCAIYLCVIFLVSPPVPVIQEMCEYVLYIALQCSWSNYCSYPDPLIVPMAGSPCSSGSSRTLLLSPNARVHRRPAASTPRSRTPVTPKAKAKAVAKCSPKAKSSPSLSPSVAVRRARAKARAQRLFDDLNGDAGVPACVLIDDESDEGDSMKERRINRISRIYSDFVQHRDHDHSYGESFERWARFKSREMVRYGWFWDPTRDNWYKLTN